MADSLRTLDGVHSVEVDKAGAPVTTMKVVMKEGHSLDAAKAQATLTGTFKVDSVAAAGG